MVELISKISKGSRMDQVYIPKNRADFAVGSYVVIKPLETMPEEVFKPFFYNIEYLEPIKLKIAEEIFKNIGMLVKYDNIIITGSFLEEGFRFNDADIIVVSENKIDAKLIEASLKEKIGIEFHVSAMSNKALLKGISTDPLYRAMLTRCISSKRLIYKINPEINYKLLDLHLLKSKPLIENFDFLTGDEKYKMTRNLAAISLFIDKKEITKDKIDSAIDNIFGSKTAQKLKDNIVLKEDFLAKYKKLYKGTLNKILEGIKNESKQK
ncbi:hypothetical protein HYU07_01675 [Candidatus Woesearchaeota archaeon]|nr:hypothetical protein [Candidatus Woesearchaeota archaeon]